MTETPGSQYDVTESGAFVIDDYNSATPFSSFFPGIAGLDGIPIWAFYVNRGQCLCSMGVQDKDHAIMEFLPANQAYARVSRQGFRTFIKLLGGDSPAFYEPFQRYRTDQQFDRRQRMQIRPWQIRLEEDNRSLNLRFSVQYFTVPQDSYAGMIRVLRIVNTGSKAVAIEGLDGLPLIVPYGVDNHCLKNMSRTIEAFLEVTNLATGAPFFRGKVEPADRPDVRRIERGNFYLGYTDGRLSAPIVDPTRIFGAQTDFGFPDRFLSAPFGDLANNQMLDNQFPCAMGQFAATIQPNDDFTFVSIIGHAPSVEELNRMIPRIATIDYVEEQDRVNRELIQGLTQHNQVCSGHSALDHYCRQNFLDNVMRGGFPLTINGEGNRHTLHVYSRKHGDLERDYNDFSLTPTPYSQGNGNYRDINQNRRSDLFFNPEVHSHNVEHFYNLIRMDGFNPLVLKETRFVVSDDGALQRVLRENLASEKQRAVHDCVKDPFTPGSLVTVLRNQGTTSPADVHRLLERILACCQSIPESDHGEGFWTDHWTYNLDLLENFRAVYPDDLEALLYDGERFTFHDSPYGVRPRCDKHVLWDGKPMQLGAVKLDEEKAERLARRNEIVHRVRTDGGNGDVYRTSLCVKLLCIIANKLASLDPAGVGIEMEAGKPNWYDALNGLPGQFGSSTNETLELKRHVDFLLEQLDRFASTHPSLPLFDELVQFIGRLRAVLADAPSDFEFWQRASDAREQFREQTWYGVSGNETAVPTADIQEFLRMAATRLKSAVEKARDPQSGLLHSYFRFEVVDYRVIETKGEQGTTVSKKNSDGLVCIEVLDFRSIPLPLFLEGQVHYLRCRPDRDEARQFAARVRESELYDDKLQMYCVNASLADQPLEIGRTRVFSPGWLENQSIWLHMEYKYLLELLRNELFEEFYEAFQTACIPFLEPAVYGRSILENSSFIVSSAHPDASRHGRGYVARLSGATAEFIEMMLLMTVGPRPFRLAADGSLEFVLEPSLPAWLFTSEARTEQVLRNGAWHDVELPEKSFSFMFMGGILVTYRNPSGKDTFGDGALRPTRWSIEMKTGQTISLDTPTLSGGIVQDIRTRRVDRIDVQLSR